MLPPTAMLPLISTSTARLIGDSPDSKVWISRDDAGVDDFEVGLLEIADDPALPVADRDSRGDEIDSTAERHLFLHLDGPDAGAS